MNSQAEGDQEILVFDIPDEALERAAIAEGQCVFSALVAASSRRLRLSVVMTKAGGCHESTRSTDGSGGDSL